MCYLQGADALGLRTTIALRDVELDPLVFIESPEAGCLDGGEMNEDVLTSTVDADETKTFICVEPLDRTLSHEQLFPYLIESNRAG